MSECMTPFGGELSAAQIQETEAVSANALDIVEARYGSGYPHYHGGENGGLAYHNRHHSRAVQRGTEQMAEALGLNAAERAIGRVAAAAHDIVQLKPRGVMERGSAEWLEAQLQGRLPAGLVQIGVLAILGTEPVLTDGKLTGQMASELIYPNRSAERVALSVACADLGELHSAQGPLLGHELYKEIQGVAPAAEPDMEKLTGFQRGQLWLAQYHQYPHPVGEQAFGRLRGAVVNHTAEVLADLEAGTLDSWLELIRRDEVFMRQHS